MNGSHPPRYCRCGTRLARDHAGEACNTCEKRLAALRVEPPDVPDGFWDTEQFRDAFAAQHIGQVSRAYRKHPHHIARYGKGGIPQEVVGGWLGLTQAQISRIENGSSVRHLDSLTHWARTLRVPAHLLWFKFAGPSAGRQPRELSRRARADGHTPADNGGLPVPFRARQGILEIDEMNRRELLALTSMAAGLLATAPVEAQLDWERLRHFADHASRPDTAVLNEYAALNDQLWRVFASAQPKSATFPLVRQQLAVLTGSLRQSRGLAAHQFLCALTGDLFQLAGEILFDSDQYTDAAQCYTLAASASKEAGAFDLWACAMTRHAFIGVYERQFDKALPMLDLAASLARRGDSALSTKHWVAVVQAQALAGLGDLNACQQALDAAEQVRQLSGQAHNGGWLRFDGARLAEERGTCYVELRRPGLAEAVLSDALNQDLSPRRRGSVLIDLAMTGVQRRDPCRLVLYADAALDAARQSRSGVVARKLQGLRAHLSPFISDRHVRQLSHQIATLTGDPVAE